jgi:Na+-transporting methylmalonyl-CoA/oxaloacetate decarboxylase gamma subunit
MINWFEKHLNWTAFLIPIISLILGFFIAGIILYLLPLGPIQSYYINDLSTQVIFAIGFCSLISSPLFYWVLIQKRMNRRLVFFFIPLFVLSALFISPILLGINLGFVASLLGLLLFLTLLVFIISWIGIIFPPKNPESQEPRTDKTKENKQVITHGSGILAKILHAYPRLSIVLICLIIVLIVGLGLLSGNGYLVHDSSTATYRHSFNTHSISFECSSRFYKIDSNVSGIMWNCDQKKWFINKTEARLFVEANPVIHPGDPQTVYLYTDNNNAAFSGDYQLIQQYSRNYRSENQMELEKLEEVNFTVGGYPADYLSFIVINPPHEYYQRGIVRTVYITDDDIVWLITMVCPEDKDNLYETYFKQILNTFKIVK